MKKYLQLIMKFLHKQKTRLFLCTRSLTPRIYTHAQINLKYSSHISIKKLEKGNFWGHKQPSIETLTCSSEYKYECIYTRAHETRKKII